MTIKVQDMLKKAKRGGYLSNDNVSPWQANSITTGDNNTHKIPSKLPSKLQQIPAKNTLNQIRDKSGTNPGQIRDKSGTNPGQIMIKSGTQTGTQTGTKKHQKTAENDFNYSSLAGLQKSITLHLFTLCKNNRSVFTPQISITSIAVSCQTTSESARKTIQRLLKKKIIISKKYKQGRSGWISCELSKDIFQEILQAENDIKSGTQTGTQTGTNSLSSSSYNININTKWENISLQNIQQALGTLDITTGQFFNNGSLKSIYKKSGDKLTSEQIQVSLDKFAYGIEHHGHTEPYVSMDNPGAILFNTLKNGDSWVEERYLTAEDLQIKSYYENICKTIIQDKAQYFDKWINEDREIKYKKYKNKLQSTQYYDDRVFLELAIEDFRKNIFPRLKIEKILQILGEDKRDLISKLIKLSEL